MLHVVSDVSKDSFKRAQKSGPSPVRLFWIEVLKFQISSILAKYLACSLLSFTQLSIIGSLFSCLQTDS